MVFLSIPDRMFCIVHEIYFIIIIAVLDFHNRMAKVRQLKLLC